MRFCEDHWGRLRTMIEERGLGGLIAPSGAIAVEQMADQLRSGSDDPTPANFDPLMSAHWAITSNAMETVSRANPQALLYVMASGAEDPVEGQPGRTWPRCPLCYLNLAHEISCTDAGCSLDRKRGYDWMLTRAADDSRATAVRLGMVK